jgi:hypothetical protein
MHDNVKEPCVNPINIQMLSANLHEQIFGKIEDRLEDDTLDSEMLKKIQYHLESHGLWDKKTPLLPDVDLQLPKIGLTHGSFTLSCMYLTQHIFCLIFIQCGSLFL